MSGILLIQLLLIVLFLIPGLIILKKKAYWLISGFNGRPKDEQEQLIKNGYPQMNGRLLVGTSIGMTILLVLNFTPFQYVLEAQFIFMLVFLLGGTIYNSRFEVPEKRKRSFLISSITSLITVVALIVIFTLGYQNSELVMNDDTFEITGLYGDEWGYTAIEKVELLEEMPNVGVRTNGFGLPTFSKGHFKVTDYGSSLLFIHHDYNPILYIKLTDKQVFINSKESAQTKSWYEELNKRIGG